MQPPLPLNDNTRAALTAAARHMVAGRLIVAWHSKNSDVLLDPHAPGAAAAIATFLNEQIRYFSGGQMGFTLVAPELCGGQNDAPAFCGAVTTCLVDEPANIAQEQNPDMQAFYSLTRSPNGYTLEGPIVLSGARQ